MTISAQDLIHWANSHTARFTLPQLLRRLILASAKKVTKLRLPSDEQVSRPGYDGVVEVEQGNAWLPSGFSVWEIGADRDPGAKAEKDFAKRNKKPGVRRSATTFLFVTPRTWLKRDQWCRRKVRAKMWKSVRALDCSDLSEWLDSVPSVAVWAARLLGKRPSGVCDITAHWQNVRDISKPALIPDLFLTGRDFEIKSLSDWLAQPAGILYVEADSADEVVDFFCALAMSRPADARVEETRGVIVETREAFRDLAASTTPLILVPTFETDAQFVQQATRHGHHVLVPMPTGLRPTQGAVKLRRLPSFEIEKALTAASFDFLRSKKIARECGGSSIVLKRLVVTGSPQIPQWATPAVAPKLAPFLLIGGWDDRNSDDCAVVASVTGLLESEVRALAQQWSRTADPLFRRKENTWMLVSRVDSWRWLAGYLEQRATDAYAKHFPDVIAVDDPRFELKPEERIMASVLGKKLKHSGELRKGMTEAFTLLSVACDSSRELPNVSVSIPLWKLFESVFPSMMNWQRWASLGDNLQLFAEARPDAFLDVLERELAKQPPSPAGLFGQEHFFSGSPVTGLVWALEILGWEPNYLLRVVLCLAALSELDPGGNWNPRPFGVLTGFLHPRFPQTTASPQRRFEVMDELAKEKPDIGWKLLLELLPKGGGISMYNPQPRWRNWSEGWHRGNRKKKEIIEEFDAIADRIVAIATHNPTRLTALLSHVSHFKAAARDRLFDALRNADPTNLDDTTRESLTKSLAEFIGDTRRAENAWWAMPKKLIDELELVLDRIQPTDLCLRHRWLFQQWPQLPGMSYGMPLQQREAAVAKARTTALQEVLSPGAMSSLRRLIEGAAAAWTVGSTLAAAKIISDKEVLPAWLDDSHPNAVEAARAFARVRFDAEGWKWIEAQGTQEWTTGQLVNLSLALPFETRVWDFVATRGQAVVDGYWNQCFGFTQTLTLPESERAVAEWLARKRPLPALELLSLIVDNQKPTVPLVFYTLEMLLATADARDVQSEVSYGGMRVGKLVKYLQGISSADKSRLIAIEWSFLPLLLGAHVMPETFFSALADQPSLFVELLGMLYRKTDERGTPAKPATQQEKNRAELAQKIFSEWRVVPGIRPDGTVDEDALRSWAEAVRQEAKTQKYEDVADDRMGELFAHAPAESDGIWPCVALRKIIEDWKSEELESGICCERFNEYQPDSLREPAEEKTWDDLVRKHRKHAEALAGRWPRTAALLRELAASYEGTARRHERDRLDDN